MNDEQNITDNSVREKNHYELCPAKTVQAVAFATNCNDVPLRCNDAPLRHQFLFAGRMSKRRNAMNNSDASMPFH
jgi:hypothetical protein